MASLFCASWGMDPAGSLAYCPSPVNSSTSITLAVVSFFSRLKRGVCRMTSQRPERVRMRWPMTRLT